MYLLLKFDLIPIGLPCALLSFQRENKNRYLFAYLKSLVDCGLFDHIYLNFLPVGHTHCDIDQLFSRVATFLKGMFSSTCLCGNMQKLRSFCVTFFFWTAHSAYTWDELAEAIRRSYVGVNQVLVLKKFINWSESIDPYLNEAAKTDGAWCAAFGSFFVLYALLSSCVTVWYQDSSTSPTTAASIFATGTLPMSSHSQCWHL